MPGHEETPAPKQILVGEAKVKRPSLDSSPRLSEAGIVESYDLHKRGLVDFAARRESRWQAPDFLKGPVPDVTLETAARFGEYSLIRKMVEMTGEGWAPDADVAKALTCRYLESVSDGRHSANTLPWPVGTDRHGQWISDGHTYTPGTEDYRAIIAKGNGAVFPKDIIETGEGGEFGSVLRTVFTRMPQPEHEELASWILDNWSELEPFMDSDAGEMMHLFAFDGMDIRTIGHELGHSMVNFVQNTVHDTDVSGSKNSQNMGSAKWHMMFWMQGEGQQEAIYRELAQGNYSTKVKNGVSRKLFLNSIVPSREMNAARTVIGDTKTPAEVQNEVKPFLRRMLGIPKNAEAYPSLNDLYNHIVFENYEIKNTMLKEYLTILTGIFREHGVSTHAEILDLGSGDGDMVAGLHDLGYVHTRGLDQNEHNLAASKRDHPHIAHMFDTGNWYDLSSLYPSDRFRVIYSLGRSLPHVEEASNFTRVIGEVSKSLKPGDLFIFDMPDPTKGVYAGAVKAYRRVMEAFGFDKSEILRSDIIVDSPDPASVPKDQRHYYNRYVPKHDSIVRSVAYGGGFRLVGEREMDIPTGKGDKNMLFIFQKMTYEELTDRRKTDDAANHAKPRKTEKQERKILEQLAHPYWRNGHYFRKKPENTK